MTNHAKCVTLGMCGLRILLGILERNHTVKFMTRIRLCAVALVTALSGCGHPTASVPSSDGDQDHWSVSVDSFDQSDTVSTLRFSVLTPVKARITFYEPNGLLRQSFISPGGRSFEVRKQLKPTDNPGTIWMETTVNGGSPSITSLAAKPDLAIAGRHSCVLEKGKRVPFGETVVIADNGDGRQTTVSIDLESDIDPDLRRSWDAVQNARKSNDPSREEEKSGNSGEK